MSNRLDTAIDDGEFDFYEELMGAERVLDVEDFVEPTEARVGDMYFGHPQALRERLNEGRAITREEYYALRDGAKWAPSEDSDETALHWFGDPRLPESFWERTEPDPATDCWVWLGATQQNGYGHYTLPKGYERPGSRYVHRITYELFKSPIPEGWTVDHKCAVRRCCNPTHLTVCTLQENTRRGQERRMARKAR